MVEGQVRRDRRGRPRNCQEIRSELLLWTEFRRVKLIPAVERRELEALSRSRKASVPLLGKRKAAQFANLVPNIGIRLEEGSFFALYFLYIGFCLVNSVARNLLRGVSL